MTILKRVAMVVSVATILAMVTVHGNVITLDPKPRWP